MNSSRITQGVLIEEVGEDLVVFVPGRLDAVRVTGEVANALSALRSGRTVSSDSPALGTLVDLGIVHVPALSRRSLVKTAAIGASAGFAVLAMPGVAAASSGTGGTGGGAGGGVSAGPVLTDVTGTYLSFTATTWFFDFRRTGGSFGPDTQLSFKGFDTLSGPFVLDALSANQNNVTFTLQRSDVNPALNTRLLAEETLNDVVQLTSGGTTYVINGVSWGGP